MNLSLRQIVTSKNIIPIVCLIALMVYGIFYVGNMLSPSSYGVILNKIGAKSEGLMWGKPQIVMNDEWAVTTPLMQIVLNNKFERYNKTSPYKEDLRGIFSLPLKDWSLIFKPTMVWFHLLPPAYAFSLHYFLIMALFLIGYSIFFYKLGGGYITAIGFALLLYFSGFVQGWWFTLGPPLAFFPWVYIATTSNKPFIIKLPLFYYLTTCLFFSWFYPIVFYMMAVSMLFLLGGFNRSFFTVRNLVIFGIFSALALATYLFYISDILEPMADEIYPGNRSLSGGDVSFIHFISIFFPSINISELIGQIAFKDTKAFPGINNLVEISSFGSYLFLLVLVFGKWKDYLRFISLEEKRPLIWLVTGFVLIALWMLLPVPASLAKFIYLDKVPGVRWIFHEGFFLLVMMVVILKRLEFSFSPLRQVIFILLVIGSCAFTVIFYKINPILTLENLIVIFAVAILFFIKDWLNFDKKYYGDAIVIVAVISNVFVFGQFNPLQSAKPIFAVPQTSYLKSLSDKSNFSAEGFFIDNKFFGLTANGLGLPAITHVLPVPSLKFFRCYFPDIPENSFNIVFNRFLIVVLGDTATPYNLQMDTSLLPQASFKSPKDPQQVQQCLREAGYLQ